MLEELVRNDDLRLTDSPSPQKSIRVHNLLEPDICDQFLKSLSKELQTTSPLVAASLFSKHYGFSFVTAVLWTMSIYDRGLPIHLNNCSLESFTMNGYWQAYLRFLKWEPTSPELDRTTWRDQFLTQLIRDHLTPLWKQLHRVTGIAPLILWENTSVYIDWLYQTKIREANITEERWSLAQEDYQALVFGLEARHFDERVQPFTRLLGDRAAQSSGRKTCCLSYLAGDEQRTCANCPRRNRVKSRGNTKQVNC